MSAALHTNVAGAAMNASFRPMTVADLDAVVAMEQRICAFPWTRGNFADSLAAGHAAWLMWDDHGIVGYALTSAALDDVELLVIGISAERQRAGCALRFMEFLCDSSRQAGARRMLLEVRASNAPARGLYARCGFVQVGLRRGYYPAPDGREDALLLERAL